METINKNIQRPNLPPLQEVEKASEKKPFINFTSVIRFLGYSISILSGFEQAGSRFDIFGFGIMFLFYVTITESIVFLYKKLDAISSKSIRGILSIILGFLAGCFLGSLVFGFLFGLAYLSGI